MPSVINMPMKVQARMRMIPTGSDKKAAADAIFDTMTDLGAVRDHYSHRMVEAVIGNSQREVDDHFLEATRAVWKLRQLDGLIIKLDVAKFDNVVQEVAADYEAIMRGEGFEQYFLRVEAKLRDRQMKEFLDAASCCTPDGAIPTGVALERWRRLSREQQMRAQKIHTHWREGRRPSPDDQNFMKWCSGAAETYEPVNPLYDEKAENNRGWAGVKWPGVKWPL